MHFEKQQHQEDCTSNIMGVLEQCDVRNNDFSNLPNAIDKLWAEKGYTQFVKKDDKKRLDILMETGTGKTFTYLKTIFEIHKQFGRKKFIIVLPRTAIKLGVIQNVNLTKDHFFHQYGKKLKIINYPEEGLEKVRQDFIRNDDFCVLVTTNSAFNSEKNTINQVDEKASPHQPKFKGLEEHFRIGSVWESIRDKKPIVIIDEPHLLKGKETQKGLDKLTDSLQIRFGATFPQPPTVKQKTTAKEQKKEQKKEDLSLSNVVYSLDSISAFRDYLVKGITVHTLISAEEQGGLKVSFIESRQNAFMVVYDINGVVHRKRLLKGEDIGVKTGLENYKGVESVKINKDKVFLSDQSILEKSKGGYALGDEEIRYMIQTTIDKHFEKEERLFKKGIKALSLFFIPRVADFREHEKNPKPRIKTIFEALYHEKRTKILANPEMDEAYKNYLQKDIDEEGKLQVHEGYFSGDKGTNDKKEADGVNIILNEKQKLLSFDTPLRFIFSVWALQEGWDNPNIFTICKLADTTKDTSRRQQVGRGLRIAVNQSGSRLTYKKLDEKESDFYNINTLDMVVSGKEKEFIKAIQEEIQEASFSLVGDTLSLDDLKHLGLSDTEASTVFNTLKKNKIIDKEGKIQSSICEFLRHNRPKLDEVSEFLDLEKINTERYQFILEKFIDNRGRIKDGNKGEPEQVTIRQDKWKEFKELWETINKKSKIVYKNIEEDTIIEEVATHFNEEEIKEVNIHRRTQRYDVQSDEIVGSIVNESETGLGKVDFFRSQSFVDFLNFFVKKEKFLFPFMVKLLNKINKEKIKNNPKKVRERLLEILKNTIHGQILSEVEYKFLKTSIYPNGLQTDKGRKRKSIRYTLLGKDFIEETKDNLLYNTICYDSQIEKEVQQNDPKTVGDKNKITVFAKLPKISIPTPYKTYNPDFAYLITKKDGKKLFLVVETKGYKNESDIPDDEEMKINYAKKFFKALQEKLKDEKIEVQYKTRLNSETLLDVLNKEAINS